MDDLRTGSTVHSQFDPVCGTVGIFVRSQEFIFATASSHVVARNAIGRPGGVRLAEIDFNGSGVLAELCDGSQTVGNTIWHSALVTAPATDCDFALIRLPEAPLADLPEIGEPRDRLLPDEPIPENVRVGLVFNGKIFQGTYRERLTSERRLPFGNFEVPYNGLHQVSYDHDTHGGMSGAAVIGLEGTVRGIVLGLHVAGNGISGFFQRLDPLWKDGRFALFRS